MLLATAAALLFICIDPACIDAMARCWLMGGLAAAIDIYTPLHTGDNEGDTVGRD